MILKRLLTLLIIVSTFKGAMAQIAFQYGAFYVGNPNGNGIDAVQPTAQYGIINVMFQNVVEIGNNNLTATAVIETNTGAVFSLTGVIYGRNNGGTISTFFWRPDADVQQLFTTGSIPLRLGGANITAVPAGGVLFKGLAVIKVGYPNVSYTAGSNIQGNSGNIVAEFNDYRNTVPQITTNVPSGFTNVQVNGWGGTTTVPANSNTVTVGVVYSTAANVNSGATSSSTATGTRLNITTYANSAAAQTNTFSTTTSGLLPNTTYYYRAYILSGTNYYQGLIQSFTTCANTGTLGYPAGTDSSPICYGGSKDFEYTSSGGTVQWECSPTSGGTFQNQPNANANANAFNTGALTSTKHFRVAISNSTSTCTVYTPAIAVVVNIPEFDYRVTSDNWDTGSNWNRSCDQGINYSISNVPPTVPSIARIGSGKTATTPTLNINAANFVIVKTGGKLVVTGSLTNNGNLKTESDACFVQTEGSTQSGTGTYTAERYMTGNGGATPNGRFWYMGAPMSGATTSAVGAGSGNKFWIYNEGPTQAYTQITNNTTAIQHGRGYVFRAGASGTFAFTSNNFGNGNVPITVTRNASTVKPGFNLVANPYPSHMNWNDLYESTLSGGVYPVEPSIWYRTSRTVNTAEVMLFDCYNAELGVGTQNSCECTSGSTASAEVTRFVAPFQSFWVRVKPGNSSVTMTAKNSMRSCGTQGFLDLVPATVRLNISNGSIKDETIVVLKDDLSNDLDYRDSGKEIPSATLPQLYSMEGSDKISINGIGNALLKDSLLLGVQIPVTGSFTINCNEFTFSDLVYLEDKITGAYVELNSTTSYSFTSEAGTFNNRFVLHFAPNVPGASATNPVSIPTSNWPQCNAITTTNSWHAFTATSEAVSISVNSTVVNAVIILQDNVGNIVAQEDALNTPGNEILNFTGLIAGQIYKVGVRNYFANQQIGSYSICVKSLKRGGCDYGSGPYNLCQYYKATWAGSAGVSYTFTFMGTSGPAEGQTFTRTQNTDICILSTIAPALPYGSTYSVSISNNYNLLDGAGNSEPISVTGPVGCQVITIAEPQTTLATSSSCSNGPRFRGAVVSSLPWVCGVMNWRWKFTEVNALNLQVVGLPFELNRGAASNFLNLGTVLQLQSGKTYAVQTAPLFSYTGTNYNWGPVRYMCIVGNTTMTLNDEEGVIGSDAHANDTKNTSAPDSETVVYVSEGNVVNVQLMNTSDDLMNRLDIYDITGKCVKSARVSNAYTQIELENASGLYFIHLSNGKRTETHRVIIKK